MQYDVIVIGSGVTGAMTAYQLSQYQLRVCVVDDAAVCTAGLCRRL